MVGGAMPSLFVRLIDDVREPEPIPTPSSKLLTIILWLPPLLPTCYAK